MNRLADIQNFFSYKQIAMIGVSQSSGELSNQLFSELVRRGYEIIPVNPKYEEVTGKQCFGHIHEVPQTPKAALLMTPQRLTEQMVLECKHAGVEIVWVYGTNGRSRLTAEKSAKIRTMGMTVIEGECPYMFLPKSGGVHRCHAFVRKVFRSYPA